MNKELLKTLIAEGYITEAPVLTTKQKKARIDQMEKEIIATGISVTAVDEMVNKLNALNSSDFKAVSENFRQLTFNEFIDGGWITFKEFFPFKGKKVGTGRGELMAVMAIKDSKSGGTGEKDLQLKNATWEVKEDPDNIRMAKSGFAGLFSYVNNIKQFYKHLEAIGLNDSTRDTELLSNLNKAFNDDAVANDVFKVLKTNFRGDAFKATKADKENPDFQENPVTADNFFVRVKIAAELPTGVIDLQYKGFERLNQLRNKLLTNTDLIKTAKMLVKTKDGQAEYWISKDDAEKLGKAKPDTDVNIRKGMPAKNKDFRVFMYNLLEIFNFDYTKSPKDISTSFTERKNDYFRELTNGGILYYNLGNPEPHKGKAADFVVYAISQNMGKMALRSKYKMYPWVAGQS